MRSVAVACALLVGSFLVPALSRAEDPLPGTEALTEARPLDEVMVAGIDRFALREIEEAARQREARWNLDYASRAAYEASLASYRQAFAERIGAVDPRVEPSGIELLAAVDRSSLVADNDAIEIHVVR